MLRTRNVIPPLPFASFFWVTESTKVEATLMTVYGIFMAPIGWKLAIIVWAYALAAFVITNLIKVHRFRFYKPYRIHPEHLFSRTLPEN